MGTLLSPTSSNTSEYFSQDLEKMYNSGNAQMGGGGFSHRATASAADMHCYFECPETFKKDADLRIHLKLRHKNEDESELRRAYQAAEEEIALVSMNSSTFQCAICTKKITNRQTFYDHTKKVHDLPWLQYKAQYGDSEVESSAFECKICGRVVKYVRESISKHLRLVHAITWPQYLERIRKMRKGEMPQQELPSIAMFECKVCSAAVKFVFRHAHLKRVHKITESEYVELFANDPNGPKVEMDANNNYAQQPNYSQPPPNYSQAPAPPRGSMYNNPSNTSNSPPTMIQGNGYNSPIKTEENPQQFQQFPPNRNIQLKEPVPFSNQQVENNL